MQDMSEMCQSTLYLTLINMKKEETFDLLFEDQHKKGTGGLRAGWVKEKHRLINPGDDGIWVPAPSLDTVGALTSPG